MLSQKAFFSLCTHSSSNLGWTSEVYFFRSIWHSVHVPKEKEEEECVWKMRFSNEKMCSLLGCCCCVSILIRHYFFQLGPIGRKCIQQRRKRIVKYCILCLCIFFFFFSSFGPHAHKSCCVVVLSSSKSSFFFFYPFRSLFYSARHGCRGQSWHADKMLIFCFRAVNRNSFWGPEEKMMMVEFGN